MRSLVIACAVMLVAGTACAGVPDATLASFGLGGMQQMTDAQGLNVRGMGSSITVNFSVTAVATYTTKSGAASTTTVLTGTASASDGSTVGLVGGSLAASTGQTGSYSSWNNNNSGGVGVAVAVGGFYAFTSGGSSHH